MTGYVRTYNKTTGDVVSADDFNNEFQAIQNAFAVGTGHKHDGTSGEGNYISVIADSNNRNAVTIDETNNKVDFSVNVSGSKVIQFSLEDGALVPTTTNDIDLGSASKKFKNLYISGTLDFSGALANQSFTGSITEEVYALSGTTPEINPENGTIQTWALSANATPTASFTSGQSVTLMVTPSGSYNITWPTISWIGTIAPTLTSGSTTVIELWKVGSTLYGVGVGDA